MQKEKIGIVQSRGLGDIVIALPIAHYFHKDGHEVYWPICEEFIPSMTSAAPWVNWISVPTDSHGQYFVAEPLRRLQAYGVEEENTLWLYQYLNTMPERTNLDHYYMMKFDQYKYAAAGLPFSLKWSLRECIQRDPEREQALKKKVVTQDRYWVIQKTASDVTYDIDTSNIDPECQIVEITELTDNIWDWLGVLESAEGMILIDSVFANIVDQLNLNPQCDRYYLRKWNRCVDGNPVFLNEWTFLPVEIPERWKFQQLDPRDQIKGRRS
jgi:hypothetical protein